MLVMCRYKIHFRAPLTSVNPAEKRQTPENFSVINHMPRSYLKVKYFILFYLFCRVHITTPALIPPHFLLAIALLNSPLWAYASFLWLTTIAAPSRECTFCFPSDISHADSQEEALLATTPSGVTLWTAGVVSCKHSHTTSSFSKIP